MSTSGVQRLLGAIISVALSRSVLWREVCVLTLMENMKLQANVEPLVGVKITLDPEIHEAPSLDTLIHIVFLALAINYANQGYMDG